MRYFTAQTLAPLAMAGMASQIQIPESGGGGGDMVVHGSGNDGGESATTTTPTSQWPGAGIFVKVDFGVSFSPTNMRRLSFNYASRNIGNQMVGGRNGIRRTKGPGALGPLNSHPLSLTPGEGNSRWGDGERSNGQERTGRRRIRSRSAMQMRTASSPVSPLSPPVMYHGQHPIPPGHNQHHSYSSGDSTSTGNIDNIIANNPFTVSSPIDLHFPSYTTYTAGPSGPTSTIDRPHPLRIRQSTIDRKPLPPLPNRFRLGEDELPWSSPMSFAPVESPFTHPNALALAGPGSTPAESSRNEDPERTRELATLQTAMMTVDSIEGEDWLSSPTGWRGWDGPGGVGWAVRVEDQMEAWEQERLRGRERRERGSRTLERERGSWTSRVGDDFRGWYGEEVSERSPWSPPPAYENGSGGENVARGTWGWEWEWEERAGYWVRADLRRSYSQ